MPSFMDGPLCIIIIMFKADDHHIIYKICKQKYQVSTSENIFHKFCKVFLRNEIRIIIMKQRAKIFFFGKIVLLSAR